MASNPKMEYQFRFGKLRQPTGQTFFPTFPKEFSHFPQTKVAIAMFIGKMQKKSGIMKSGLDAMPLFLLDNLSKVVVANS